jgi:hypothetical protein
LVSEADRLTKPTDFDGNDEIGVMATFYGIINYYESINAEALPLNTRTPFWLNVSTFRST